MKLRSIRGGLASNQEYVCLSCRLQSRLSQAQRNPRYQHTSTPSTDRTPNPSDGIIPQVPPLPYGQAKREIKRSKDLQNAKAQLPAFEVRQLEDALQQKFLEKRRLEGLLLPANTPSEEVRNSESQAVEEAAGNVVDKAHSKKSKDEPAIERKAALKPKRKAKGKVKKAAVKVQKTQKAPSTEKPEKKTTPSKQKLKKAKKAEKPRKEEKPSTATSMKVSKPRKIAEKARATKKLSGSNLVERLKSDIMEFERALKPRTKNERNLILERALSEASEVAEPTMVPDAPRPSLSIRRATAVRLGKTRSNGSEKPPTPKEMSRRGSSRSRIRRTVVAPKKAPEPTKLSRPSRNRSLGAALGVGDQEDVKEVKKAAIQKINADDLKLQPLEVERLPVPTLAYGLERVLFNSGVYHLQDPRSKVFNFDPYLQKIMPVTEFDFDALKKYITSSKDMSLKQLAGDFGKRYVGSTSSMTGILAHFHFLLSQWRSINTSMLSKEFPDKLLSFTELQRCPSAIFLRWQDGSYAIDADKQFDNANILMMLGKSMEKLLTLDTGEFERYRRSNSEQVTEEERNAPEAFHYTTIGDFLMRSQLDAFDPRLPGTGMFDLKTRAVVSIRMEPLNHENGVGYQIKTTQGEWESFEREYYDMIRAAFLKYSLQVRMGRMDGIFVAYHNTDRIFGFQYISIEEMDFTLHGQWDTSVGDQEFKLSLNLLNKVLNKATKKYPKKSLRIHFETREVATPFMYIFAEPVTDEQIQEIQTRNAESVEAFQRKLQGLDGENLDSEPTLSEEDRWADIQANVQEAMARDEISIADPSGDDEPPHAAAHDNSSESEHSGVFEAGPLYKNRSLYTADNDDVATAAGSEEEEVETEEADENGEDEDVEVDYQEKASDLANDSPELEGDEQSQLNNSSTSFEDASEDKNVIEVTNEREIDEHGLGKEDVAEDRLDLDNKVDDSDLAESLESVARLANLDQREGENTRNVQEEDLESLGQEVTQEGKQPEAGVAMDSELADLADDSSGEADGDSDIQEQPALPDDGFDTRADQPFLEEIDQEYSPAPGSEVLAMALTVRNKVNGEFVQRPENINQNDKWSVEYTLEEVPKPDRAWSLYLACQERRRQKLEGYQQKQEDDSVNDYLRHLRNLSRKGAVWRKDMDKEEQGMKVAVVGQPISREDVKEPSKQRPEE